MRPYADDKITVIVLTNAAHGEPSEIAHPGDGAAEAVRAEAEEARGGRCRCDWCAITAATACARPDRQRAITNPEPLHLGHGILAGWKARCRGRRGPLIVPRVSLYDARAGRFVKVISPPDRPGGWVRCVAFSPDQKRLAWGEHGGEVRPLGPGARSDLMAGEAAPSRSAT